LSQFRESQNKDLKFYATIKLSDMKTGDYEQMNGMEKLDKKKQVF